MEAHRVQLKVALILLFINSVLTQQVPLSSESERSALLALRSSLGLRARYWPRKADPCTAWTGLECRNGRVVGINISGLSRTRVGRLNSRFSVDSLANITLLASFNSSGFSLPGAIPDWFGQRLNALQVLDLRSCSILGPIPPSIGELRSLNSLYLSDNSLTGIIPATLGRLLSLSILDLSRNSFTGSIPSDISALHNLTILNLSSNFLSGSILSSFGSLTSLQYLNLYNNSLANTIPSQLGNLSQLIELDLGFNFLSGSLPEELRGLRSLQKLSVGNNGLQGPLPRTLFLNLTLLEDVVLSWNRFDGGVPDVLWSSRRLRFLDVSGNNLTDIVRNLTANSRATDVMFNFSNNLFYGNLPSLVGNFSLVDLSSNYFQGPSNNTGTNAKVTRNCLQSGQNQRTLEDCRVFYAKRGLAFGNDRAPHPTLSPLPELSKSNNNLTYIMVGLFGGIGLVVILVLVLILLRKRCNNGNAKQREIANNEPVPEGGSSPNPKVFLNLSSLGESFTYEQMALATCDFNDMNLIKHGHSGDLFRGTLGGGTLVVIKRIDMHSLGKESFQLELELFSQVSHARLIPLLGHCLEHESEKLLVYKYMPNGDLSNSLYRITNLEDDSLQSLDWITRLKIAIGAAEGLSYLHHECSPPLVHRDVQASSVLLDDKYEVRLGSLTEVRAQGADDHQHVITRLLRMPPTFEQGPSGSSSGTCAYDVYCFGIVLLELITGKLGTSKSDDVNSKEWLEHNLPFISTNEKELVSKIVDQSLIIDEDLLEEVWAMAIVAKSCLNPKPSKRPLMRHILKALENPLKVVREESYSSARLRTTSSRRSWSAAFFGSWNHSSSENAGVPGAINREVVGGLKQSGRVGSHGSGGNELFSSRKRLSNEIFPEPVDMEDIEAR